MYIYISIIDSCIHILTSRSLNSAPSTVAAEQLASAAQAERDVPSGYKKIEFASVSGRFAVEMFLALAL